MFNEVKLIGNLGKDPEIHTTQDGKKIANLSIATTERWKDKQGERKERTEWHRVVIFSDGLSGVAEQYLHKGSKVFICGKLQTSKWTDKNGQDRYSTEVVLQGFDAKLIMLDGQKNSGDQGNSRGQDDTNQSSSNTQSRGDMDDEIPF